VKRSLSARSGERDGTRRVSDGEGEVLCPPIDLSRVWHPPPPLAALAPATRPTALRSAPHGFDREAIERVATKAMATWPRWGAGRAIANDLAHGWAAIDRLVDDAREDGTAVRDNDVLPCPTSLREPFASKKPTSPVCKRCRRSDRGGDGVRRLLPGDRWLRGSPSPMPFCRTTPSGEIPPF
jgi:hypothetical protein